ncbi:hypothetical protein HD842_001344 [Massilia aurea]|jgi:hypothetical protein|uniref:Lipoprotein n=1 Tax=Massilia aurea TaxID=373040 RepID=A0A7W9WYL4_9BURK|nr:hypothetical protein [Massilia aurea]MBB6133233.1 hypothetical protein [Massilia aurea]
MKKCIVGLALIVLFTAGCATTVPAPAAMPAPTDMISALPVVKMGTPPLGEGEFVLHIPANSPVPLKVTTRGSLLKGSQSVTGSLTFGRDIYIYKYWSSYDRKTWENSHKLLNVAFSGGMDASGLNVNVGLDTNRE